MNTADFKPKQNEQKEEKVVIKKQQESKTQLHTHKLNLELSYNLLERPFSQVMPEIKELWRV